MKSRSTVVKSFITLAPGRRSQNRKWNIQRCFRKTNFCLILFREVTPHWRPLIWRRRRRRKENAEDRQKRVWRRRRLRLPLRSPRALKRILRVPNSRRQPTVPNGVGKRRWMSTLWKVLRRVSDRIPANGSERRLIIENFPEKSKTRTRRPTTQTKRRSIVVTKRRSIRLLMEQRLQLRRKKRGEERNGRSTCRRWATATRRRPTPLKPRRITLAESAKRRTRRGSSFFFTSRRLTEEL